jgi:hypothetical protein
MTRSYLVKHPIAFNCVQCILNNSCMQINLNWHGILKFKHKLIISYFPLVLNY